MKKNIFFPYFKILIVLLMCLCLTTACRFVDDEYILNDYFSILIVNCSSVRLRYNHNSKYSNNIIDQRFNVNSFVYSYQYNNDFVGIKSFNGYIDNISCREESFDGKKFTYYLVNMDSIEKSSDDSFEDFYNAYMAIDIKVFDSYDAYENYIIKEKIYLSDWKKPNVFFESGH